MEKDELILIGTLIGIVLISHLLIASFFTKLSRMFFKPKTHLSKRSLSKFSLSIKWGLFFVIWPIIEPLVSPENWDYLMDHPLFRILFIVNLSWILIELSNVLRYYFIENLVMDKADNLKERKN